METNDDERIMALPDSIGASTPGELPDGARLGHYDEQTSTVDDACLDEEDSDECGSQMGGYRMETDNTKESNVGDTDGDKKGNSRANLSSKTGTNSDTRKKETMERRPPPIPANNTGYDGMGGEGEPTQGFRAQYHVIKGQKRTGRSVGLTWHLWRGTQGAMIQASAMPRGSTSRGTQGSTEQKTFMTRRGAGIFRPVLSTRD
jgi:hypothetical protein